MAIDGNEFTEGNLGVVDKPRDWGKLVGEKLVDGDRPRACRLSSEDN